MKSDKERRVKESEIFFWGVFWGITIMGLEDISWMIKIILFAILIMVWVFYIFYPPPFTKNQNEVYNKQNAKRNITILSSIVVVLAIVIILLIRNYF